MPWNGSGTFTRNYSWVIDKNNGINITASRMDADTNDIVNNGLNNCLTRDGQGIATANLPMASFRHTGVGLGVSATDYARMDQAQQGQLNWAIAGGTADAITATYSPAIAALTDGLLCAVRMNAANATTTPTFSPNGLTAHIVTTSGGSALTASAWAQYQEVLLRYNLANTRWELIGGETLFVRSGATVTNPLASNLVLTSSSNQVQSVAPNAAGLAVQLPDATTMQSAGASVFEVNNRPNNGLFPVQIIDSASNCIGWLRPGARILAHLDSISAATGGWRLASGDSAADASGVYPTRSQSSPTSSTVFGGNNQTVSCQLSITNGIWGVVNSTTLSLYGWQEGEGTKKWGSVTTITITAGWFSLVPLTSTTALIVYVDGAVALQSAVVSLNTSTLAVTVGSTSQITTDAMGSGRYLGTVALSSALVLVPYVTSAGLIRAATVSVSGTTATANAVVSSSVTTTGTTPIGVRLSATLAHVYFRDTSNGISLMRVTISGTAPSWASPVIVKSDTSYNDFAVTPVDATHSGCVYWKNGTITTPVSSVIVIDGSPVTLGTESASIMNGRLMQGVATTTAANLISYGTKAYGMFAGQNSSTFLQTTEMVRFAVSSSAITVDGIAPISYANGKLTNGSVETYQAGGCFQIPWLDSGSAFPMPQSVLAVAA